MFYGDSALLRIFKIFYFPCNDIGSEGPVFVGIGQFVLHCVA